LSNNNRTTDNRFSATGGTITDADGYRIHVFTSPGSFVVSGVGDVEYLVVAGGGGGGHNGSNAGSVQSGSNGGSGIVIIRYLL